MKRLLLFLVAAAASCMVWAAPDFPSKDFPTADFPNNPPDGKLSQKRPVRQGRYDSEYVFKKPTHAVVHDAKKETEQYIQQALEKAEQEKFLFGGIDVEVEMAVKTPGQNGHSEETLIYRCPGFFINRDGYVVVHRDCSPAIEMAKEFATPVSLFVDMHELGWNEDRTEPLSESSNRDVKEFTVYTDSIGFWIKDASEYSWLGHALQVAFPSKKKLTKKQLAIKMAELQEATPEVHLASN